MVIGNFVVSGLVWIQLDVQRFPASFLFFSAVFQTLRGTKRTANTAHVLF